jgi:type II secretory pathway pseudopilin PulG
MEKNKTGKYLKYAIGEIVLVVIGILIALSINNWNDNQKDQKQAKTYLKGIIQDLRVDTLTFNSHINNYKELIRKKKLVLIPADYSNMSVDTLDYFFESGVSPYKITDQTYQKLKNLGVSKLTVNPELTERVNYYYGKTNDLWNAFRNWDYEITNKEEFFWRSELKNIEIPLKPYSLVQDQKVRKEQLIELIKSPKGRNYLKFDMMRNERVLGILEETLDTATKLLFDIQKEISE